MRQFALNICGKWPGKNWVSGFVKRHQVQITSQYLVGFDITRKKADNWWLVNHYFELVKRKQEEYEIEPGNTYNMDEKGFLIGVLQKTRRIFTRSWNKQEKLQGACQDGNRTWITLLACICADGTSLPPALIYPAVSGDIQDSWLDDFNPADGTYFASSPTGWTNNKLALDWLERVFDRHTKKKAGNGRQARLLILDGHSSHINIDFLEWCILHNIHICAFPPHSTHRLQPLDVSLFRPLATYYSQELDQWIFATQALCRMNKRQFYKLFKPAFHKAFSEANILSGWRQTGLHPFEPSIILSQLSTKPASRPTSQGSGHSAISTSDWKRINKLVRDAIGDSLGYKDRKVLQVYHQLQAENALLKAQVVGLEEAIRVEKKQKKPRKALFKELRDQEGNTAIFFSPSKVAAVRELQAQKTREAEAVQAQKRQQQLQREQQKRDQEEKRHVAAVARQQRREQQAQEKAQKQAERERANTQQLVSRQLVSEHQATSKRPRQRHTKLHDCTIKRGGVIKPNVEPQIREEEVATSRSGRQLRKPQHLDMYQL